MTIQQQLELLNFLQWLEHSDYGSEIPFGATPSEAMLAAGKAFKEIRKRAREFSERLAQKPPGACL